MANNFTLNPSITRYLCNRYKVQKVTLVPLSLIWFNKDTDKMGKLFLLGGYKVEAPFTQKGDSAMVYEGELFIFKGLDHE